MRNTDIVIVGAGGQGLIVADILLAAHAAGDPVRPVAFVDDRTSTHQTTILGLPVVGSREALPHIPHDAVIVAIGDNSTRRAITDTLLQHGERLATARHPTAWLSRETQIGAGTMLSVGAVILPQTTIGRGCLINSRATVDHNSTLGDFVHVSCAAAVGAHVTIGDEVLVAMGAVVTSGRTIGARTVIGAGAVVVRDLEANVRAWGVPARVVR